MFNVSTLLSFYIISSFIFLNTEDNTRQGVYNHICSIFFAQNYLGIVNKAETSSLLFKALIFIADDSTHSSKHNTGYAVLNVLG